MLETTQEKYDRVQDKVIRHPRYRQWVSYYRKHEKTFQGGHPGGPGSAIMKWSTDLMLQWLRENPLSGQEQYEAAMGYDSGL